MEKLITFPIESVMNGLPDVTEVRSISTAAIQRIGGSPTVFVAEGRGEFVPRKVKLGEASGDYIEIKAGLKAG